MRWFMDLPLRWKLLLTFGVGLAMTAAVGGLALSRLSLMHERLEALYATQLPGLTLIAQANDALIASSRDEGQAILAAERAEIEHHAASARRRLADSADALARSKERPNPPETRRLLGQLEQDYRELSAGREVVLRLALEGKDGEATAEAARLRPVAERADQRLKEVRSLHEEVARSRF